ncbi:DUF945 family protein [Vreelandella aquamarina]
MRKERLVVPILAVLAALWVAAQLLSSILFEHSLRQALDDLNARGEWRMQRVESHPGWLNSHGRIIISPLLGRPWQLEVSYEARHGLWSTDVEGHLRPRLDTQLQQAVGDVSVRSYPSWRGRYHTLSGRTELRLALAPVVIEQNDRKLDVRGARMRIEGIYGDWRLNGMIDSLTLTDRDATLQLSPIELQSRYTYIEDAYHFNQHDHLHIGALTLTHPDLDIQVTPIDVRSEMRLDERELRIIGELAIGEAVLTNDAPDTPILQGRISAELSRINADAVRQVFAQLRQEAAWGDSTMPVADGLLARLEPGMLAALKDSPRLDINTLDLDSPLLDIHASAEGAFFFDARNMQALSIVHADETAMQDRWRSRLDGDITWNDAPSVAALWLGLPIGTRSLTFDLIQGSWRVNGRPLPEL